MRATLPPDMKLLTRLTSPAKIQDFLDTLPINHEKGGETCFSPRTVLQKRKIHCLEGALFAAAALAIQGKRPLLMNLRTAFHDDDHAVALFKERGLWGAISKTNHAVLRYRDPIYKTLRELALSYFHEYFKNDTGTKTLRAYSSPFSLSRYGTRWITDEKPLWHIAHALRDSRHYPLVRKDVLPSLRRASVIERKAGHIVEWK